MEKTKIVLDADVIIHFMKGECLNVLLDIFPEYEYLILDVVYLELSKNKETKKYIDRHLDVFSKKIRKVTFSPIGDSQRDYFKLTRTLGKGECACMIYCKDNRNVLGSSNLLDIKSYCEKYQVTYLTTLDFLYYAFVKKVMTGTECNEFIQTVIEKGSKLPYVNIEKYTCEVML